MVAKVESKLADRNDIPQIGNAQAVIANPTGGTTTDAEGRAAVVSILNVLRYHGLIKT